MPLSPDFIDYAVELIAGFGPVEVKKMFGGAQLSRNGVGFGILDDDTFFLKADPALGAEMKRQGSRAWSYSIGKDGKPRDIAFWSLPASAADDPDEAAALAKRSYAIAVTLAAEKAKPKKKAPAKAAAKKAAPAKKATRKPAAKK